MPFLTVDDRAQTISATVDVVYTVDPRAQPLFRDVVPPPPPPRPTGGGGGGGFARPGCPPGYIWSDRYHCCIPLEQYEWERQHPPSEEEFYERFQEACRRELSEDEAEQISVAMGLGLDERPYALTAALIGLALRRRKD